MGEGVGSIAGPALEFLLKSAVSLIKEEIGLIRNFKKDLNELKESLEMIRDFLEDAERKQVTDKAVKRWLINLEAVAFDADNVLDELNYEVHRRKMEPGNKLKKKVGAYFSTRKMGLEIRSITEKLKSINQQATEFGLQKQLSAYVPDVVSNLTLTERETASNPDPFVVGRANYVSSIVEILTCGSPTHDEQEVFSVIPIVGMGGLGKTTLAKSVFNHNEIEAHFEKRIWVYVSEKFDEMALLRNILESLRESSNEDSENVVEGFPKMASFKMIFESLRESSNEDVKNVLEGFPKMASFKKIFESHTESSNEDSKDVLLKELQKFLKAQKYLLVLDDVWTEETKKWDDFVDTLSSITSVKGNGIVVTTQSETVAAIVGRAHIQKLSELADEDCWAIIKEKTFKKGSVIPLEFESIGRKIANKCRGLPLAAKVVGGVLHWKTKKEWYSIEKTQLSNLGDDGNTMRKILKLSFDNLPSQSLKKCFAFCAIFPKGYEIKKSMLIGLWMAEGFLQSDDMETQGNKYFDHLLHNSLLQIGERSSYGSVLTCTMHDLLCDLALSVLKESGPVRYIYLRSITDIPKEEARNVRSLIVGDRISDEKMLLNFKHLRGLVLNGYYDRKRLPKFEHLIHLRCFDIPHGLIEFPKSIGNLYLLQTLRAKVASKELPKALKKLINLRHVDVKGNGETLVCPVVPSQTPTSAMNRFTHLKTLDINRMYSSSLMEDLLVNVTSLTSLQFDQLRGLVCLPDEFFHNNQNLNYVRIIDCGNLTHLPPRFGISLKQVEIGCCSKLEGLPEIPHSLDKLTLWECPNVKSIPYNPSCNGSPSLRELEITHCPYLTELPIGLLEPCTSLESVSLLKLASLKNMGMVFACLQKMPRLTSLKVDLKEVATADFPIEIVDGSFNSLRDLEITCGMEIWHRLQDLLQHLNALTTLSLRDIKMEAVPECLGKLPSLMELELCDFQKLRSLPSKEALKHLTRLRIVRCPLLNLRRDNYTSEWHKVSDIADLDLQFHGYQG